MNRLNRCVVNTQRRNLNLKENRAETKRIFFSLFVRPCFSFLSYKQYLHEFSFVFFCFLSELIWSSQTQSRELGRRFGKCFHPAKCSIESRVGKISNSDRHGKNLPGAVSRRIITTEYHFNLKKKKLNKQTSKTIPTIMIKYHAFQVNAVNDVDNDGNKR